MTHSLTIIRSTCTGAVQLPRSRTSALCPPTVVHRKDHAPAPGQRGQSSVEFMLMIPVLFSVIFFVVQTSLYFTTIHYANYAAYATARAQTGGFNSAYPTASDVSKLILSGSVWGSIVAESVSSKTGVSVAMTGFERRVPFPFISAIVPSMDFSTSVYLGPRELDYEGVEGRPADQYDNNAKSR